MRCGSPACARVVHACAVRSEATSNEGAVENEDLNLSIASQARRLLELVLGTVECACNAREFCPTNAQAGYGSNNYGAIAGRRARCSDASCAPRARLWLVQMFFGGG